MDEASGEWADLLFKTVPFDMDVRTMPTAWALLALRALLDVHKPQSDDYYVGGLACPECGQWPCDVYTAIKEAADYDAAR